MKKINKKEKEEGFDFIENHVWHILHCANLSHFMVQFAFGTSAGSPDFRGAKPAHMTMDTDHTYLTASLLVKEDWFFAAWRNKEYEPIISYLCHEISHILTSELPDKMKVKYSGDGKYYQERVTEHVGRYIFRLYGRFRELHKIDLKTGEFYVKRKTKN